MRISSILTAFFCLGISITGQSQNLSDKQTAGLHAASNIKIDGKAAEWPVQFQAYNHATEIYYSMANDNENLYLIVQTKDPDIALRITGGGITWTIQKSGKKEEKGSVSITYPIIQEAPNFILRKKKNQEPDTTASTADSVMRHNNVLLAKSCKLIKITGITALDPLISVYNDDGIRAACLFNTQKVFTCEFAVKLSRLALEKAAKFSYNIRLNGKKPIHVEGIASSGNEEFMKSFVEKANALSVKDSAPTDFWGEYLLVK